MASRNSRSRSKSQTENSVQGSRQDPVSSAAAIKTTNRRRPSKSPTKKTLERKGGGYLDSEPDSLSSSSRGRSKWSDGNADSSAPPTRSGLPVTPPAGKMTTQEIENEVRRLTKVEEALRLMREKVAEKQIILEKLLTEVMRMSNLFEKAKDVESAKKEALTNREEKEVHRLTVEQRKQLLEKGPFNLIFHGVETDWIETEMDDDPEFQRDVLEQKIKTLIREEVGIARDVGIIDCYRYTNGALYREAYPIVVEFKARREKEQILWRSKDKLRKKNIIVTDDTESRIAERAQQLQNDKKSVKKKDKANPPVPPEMALFGDFL